jgi:hypothetical protein
LQIIIGTDRNRFIAEAKIEECLIQQHPGIIAGKRSSGGIGTVHPRRQPNDQQLDLFGAEGRHRTGVVTGILLAHLIKKGGKARATTAIKVKHGGRLNRSEQRFYHQQNLQRQKLGLHKLSQSTCPHGEGRQWRMVGGYCVRFRPA